MKWLALEDLEKLEAAGLLAERHDVRGGFARVVLVIVRVELRLVAAVEGLQPGGENVAGGSIGNRGLRGRKCRSQAQQKQNEAGATKHG